MSALLVLPFNSFMVLTFFFFFFSDGKLVLTKSCPWCWRSLVLLAGACFRTGIDIAWWEVLGRAQHCTTFPRIWVKTKETLSVLPSLNSCDDSGLHKLEGKKKQKPRL